MSVRHYEFEPHDVCSEWMSVDVEGGIVKNFKSRGGCGGNILGVKKLVEGMKVEDVIYCLRGVQCGDEYTSCPDQLARELERNLEEIKNDENR